MHIERVLEIINNSRIPESRKRFWPTWSAVFIEPSGNVADVVQYFEQPNAVVIGKDHSRYPGTAYFLATAGSMYPSVEALRQKIRDCVDALTHVQVSEFGDSTTLLHTGTEWHATKRPSDA